MEVGTFLMTDHQYPEFKGVNNEKLEGRNLGNLLFRIHANAKKRVQEGK